MRAAALAAALSLGLALAGAPGPASAVPPPARAAIEQPRLAGEGVLRWFGLKVYQARLWVGRNFDPQRPEAAPFSLELQYARALPGEKIAERSLEEIARLGYGREDQRRNWFAAMRGIFPDVSEGDRVAGVYRPGGPTSFYLNDRRIGEVSDPEFGVAFFAIWLDRRTVAPSLREALLRAANDR